MAEVQLQIGCDGLNWVQMRGRFIEDDFHNGRTLEQYKASFLNTDIVVLAFADGGVVGTVRVLTDGVCNAYIVDVWTYKPYRGQGIARQMMALAETQLAGQHVYLFTDAAVGMYEKLGYAPQDLGMGKVVGRWLKNM